MNMKITAGVDERGDLELEGLYPGDGLMFSVTHEVKIDGESSWVKYGAQTSVRPGESTEEAYQRLVEHVNQGAMEGVTAAVVAVRGFVAQQRTSGSREMSRR